MAVGHRIGGGPDHQRRERLWRRRHVDDARCGADARHDRGLLRHAVQLRGAARSVALPAARRPQYLHLRTEERRLSPRPLREPYPAADLAHFAALARAAHQLGMRFVFALSPGAGFDPSGNDQAILHDKLASLLDAEVRDFCLFFDDLAPNSAAADPQVEVRIVSDARRFLRRRAATTLCFIPHYYAGTAAEIRADSAPFSGQFTVPSSAAYAVYATLPADVPMLWTGPRVFASPLSIDDAAAFRALATRPVIVWDNFPVNDVVLGRELFLSPYRAREPGVEGAVDGVVLNTMLQPQASKIALWTAGRFFADSATYDPDTAFDEALVEVAGSAAGAAAVAVLAEQFRSHPLIGDEIKSPTLVARSGDFFADRSAEHEAALRALFATFVATPGTLDRDVANAALAGELREPAHKLALYGTAGALALDLLADAARGDAVDATELNAQLADARSIPWLVGANTPIGPGLDRLLTNGPVVRADAFGDFFRRVDSDLAAAR
ncbi:MAG: beta-N-acetylglucosaminidase domain-containing protein [bacterium]